ncbi:5-bromo-4-chloroindolyl phosphate hydrolysis family protein [Halovulum sp. GXIMD14793]
MQLADGPRQIVAGLAASAVFLTLFFGLSLVWWLALGLSVATYFALLLLVQRRRPLDEVHLAQRVTAADIRKAEVMLSQAGTRLERAAVNAPKLDRTAIEEMAKNVHSIRERIVEDPDDFRAARRFVTVYLPKVVQTVESYTKVSRQASGRAAERLEQLGEQIRGYAPVIERINEACIENDLRALELEAEVLSATLERT